MNCIKYDIACRLSKLLSRIYYHQHYLIIIDGYSKILHPVLINYTFVNRPISKQYCLTFQTVQLWQYPDPILHLYLDLSVVYPWYEPKVSISKHFLFSMSMWLRTLCVFCQKHLQNAVHLRPFKLSRNFSIWFLNWLNSFFSGMKMV